ncbi:MAG: glycosyltransferase family 9 protein, partial [Candidatus Omnitrophota bacterium]|nr:glycosyltransferase family 9 protein [Candidatus Omnitrophota bacterium]
MLGIEKPSHDLELWPSAEDEEAARRLLEGEWVGENQVLVGINPGASPKWATKKWSPENFAKVCDALALEEIRTVLVGSAAEAETGIEILKLTKSKPINLIGKTSLTELAALMKRFKCLITSDSAPMHIAAAMKTPFVALFGPTGPMRHLPPAEKYVVITKDLRCAPCYKPVCSDTRCMREITVAEVLKAVREI